MAGAGAERLLRNAGLTVSVREAAQVLGVSHGLAYDLIGRKEFPCRVLRLGRRYRVPTAELRRAVGLVDEPAA